MRTRDEGILGKIYENIGNYPPGMTRRDWRHVYGEGEPEERVINDDTPMEILRELPWEIIEVTDKNIDGAGTRLVTIKAYDEETNTEYTADASEPYPYEGNFEVIENIEEV
jgi:hypothetical protein